MKLIEAIKSANNMAAYFIARGINLEYVSKEEKKKRLDACRGCEKYNPAQGRCTVCGCFMRFKAGLKYDPNETGGGSELITTSCPDGIW